jgi:Domain of unknown function (DUF4396)
MEATMFNAISCTSLALAFLCAILIAIDEVRHPQKMWIMNVVWPVTALYFSTFGLWGYFRAGRKMTKVAMTGKSELEHMQMTQQTRSAPTFTQAAISDSHCGAGCTLGDIFAEFSLYALGWTLLGKTLYAEFAGDLLLAWLLGIAFQYFAIGPMRNLSPAQALIAAIKSDTLSIITFEIGLFAWMALTFFVFFPQPHLTPTEPGYWFMMQIGMILGFFTSYPANWLLIRVGWKEAMG